MLNAVLLMETTGGSAMDGLVSSMTSGFTTMASDAIGAIGSILPVVLPILGALIVINIGIKTVKKTTRG